MRGGRLAWSMKNREWEGERVFLTMEIAWTKAGCGQRAWCTWDCGTSVVQQSGVTLFHNHKPQMDIPHCLAILLLSLTNLLFALTKMRILYYLSSHLLPLSPLFSKAPKSHQATAPLSHHTKTTNQFVLTFSNALLVMMGWRVPLFVLEPILSHLLRCCPAGSPNPCISNCFSHRPCSVQKHALGGFKS